MKEQVPKDSKDIILQILTNKYQADPVGFHAYLPEIAQKIESLFPSQSKRSHISALTEPERERLRKALLQLLDKPKLSVSEAVQALEYCATFVQDESLPQQVDRGIVLRLLRQATNMPTGKLKRNTLIPVCEGGSVKEIALLKGVYLQLAWNDRLIAVSILPGRMKERSKALKFVGIAKDSESDVSQQHDAYLSEGIECHLLKE